MAKTVLMIGWHPDVVNYDKWPELTPEKLQRGLMAEKDKLQGLGLHTTVALIRDGNDGLAKLKQKLTDTAYDIVMIGAGVRRDEDHFLTFEKLINLVHEHAPQARFAFNTNPADTTRAIQRWA